MSSTGKRRSQKERSAETSARLMNATIDLLHDQGLARTTTPEIARVAGVSRGALTHHFASREAIISASVAHLLSKSTQDLHRFAEDFVARGGTYTGSRARAREEPGQGRPGGIADVQPIAPARERPRRAVPCRCSSSLSRPRGSIPGMLA